MPNPTIGHLTCPICGNPEAIVRQEKKGRVLYYSCYADGDEHGCGTIQCRLPPGQRFIRANMRPLSPQQQDEAANEAAAEAAEQATTAARTERRRHSPLAGLARGFKLPEGAGDE